MKKRTLIILGISCLLGLFSCDRKSNIPIEEPLTVSQPDSIAVLLREESMTTVAPQLAEGLQISLWATDSLAPDPVAMDIDDHGRIFLTRTQRQKNSEFDIRGHVDWMTRSISLQSVEDRRAFLKEEFSAERSEQNSWLKDLNNDSIHDWRDLAVEKEEVWMLEDQSGDGMADKATRILSDFNQEITDIAGGLMVDGDDVYVGVGPDLWKLSDENGDLVLDTKTSLATGFAVHIGFGGHGMSGVTRGPDGKLYWGIGDIGASITAKDGSKHHYPNQGVIVRCNPDGSNFEVFARGLRNTHEFTFDKYGNLISEDNDGDHAGESERLVYLVDGSDTGWRTNWQFGKYTDPKNNSYKVWMDEKLYVPRWEGQAAYILPPIQNYHNGPTGMIYNPGTALGSKWQDQFFVVEFVGEPGRSHIWSFRLENEGAGFKLKEETDVLSGILPTGIRFGPDGALYLADWINGWGTKNYGKVWKLDVSQQENDLALQRQQTQELMTADYEDMATDSLISLLSYPDMRIRQKAQFQIATSTFWGYRALKTNLEESSDQLGRIHSIWAIGQMAEKDVDKADALVPLLKDADPEIVAQVAKVLGDVRYPDAGQQLIALLSSAHPRVRFFAAQALGRTAEMAAVQPLLDMLAENADQDVYLRHAGVMALSRIGDAESMLALSENDNRSLRLAAVLVLRRLQHEGIRTFLNDSDEYIVTEAARAINDDWSIEAALPDLVQVLKRKDLSSEPLFRRAINAAIRTGAPSDLDALIAYAMREDIPDRLRAEALAAIGTWAEPSVLDRVDGRFRGAVQRNREEVVGRVSTIIPQLLQSSNENVLAGVGKLLTNLRMDNHNVQVKQLFNTHPSGSVRASMLAALGENGDPQIQNLLQQGMKDPDNQVKVTAIGLLSKLDLPATSLPGIVAPVFAKGSQREQQRMLGVLAEMPPERTIPVLQDLLNKAGRNQVAPGIVLDLIETAEAANDSTLSAGLTALKGSGFGIDSFKETLYGGSNWPGRQVFNTHPGGQCVRCHSLNGAGGQVGPPMDGIGSRLSREQLLESLIMPSASLAPGYGSVRLELDNGQTVIGLLLEEHKDHLLLRTTAAEPMEVETRRIKTRRNLPSAMPPMGSVLSKREIRNLIEFLSGLKDPDA